MKPYFESERGKLFNGDCLEYMQSLQDKSIDLVLTDPPYGIGENGKQNLTRIGKAFPKNYGNYDWDKKPLPQRYFTELKRVSKNQIIFGGNYYGGILGNTSCYIVWDKDNSGDFADCELVWTSFKTAVRKIKWRWNGCLQEDMANKETRYYPTQKPVPVMMWILRNYAKMGQLIMDPFIGSGTTAIACENLGFQWIGIDKSEQACAIAKKRILRETRQYNLFGAEG